MHTVQSSQETRGRGSCFCRWGELDQSLLWSVQNRWDVTFGELSFWIHTLLLTKSPPGNPFCGDFLFVLQYFHFLAFIPNMTKTNHLRRRYLRGRGEKMEMDSFLAVEKSSINCSLNSRYQQARCLLNPHWKHHISCPTINPQSSHSCQGEAVTQSKPM